MQVVETKHFKNRLDERSRKPPEKVRESFKEAVSLVKKHKLQPKRGYGANIFRVRHDGHWFVYEKLAGTYCLITYYQSKW